MIKIRKQQNGPTIPNRQGRCKLQLATDDNNLAYDQAPEDYNSGNQKFKFDSKLYGHNDIKDLLRQTQRGKCAFCEQNVSSVDYGDIEILIDGGGRSPGIIMYLSNYVDGAIEVMVATHPHADHIGGLMESRYIYFCILRFHCIHEVFICLRISFVTIVPDFINLEVF